MKQRLLVVDTPKNLRQRLYGRQVVFHLRQASPALVELINGLPFTREARAFETASGVKIVAGVEDPEAHNPVIIRKLVEAGTDIQFVGELRHSLEDVYLSLMQSTRNPASGG
jgi:ABC-2 type transport system ATP-binding protein